MQWNFPGRSQEGLGMSKENALGGKHEILVESISWQVCGLAHRHNISEKSHIGMSLLCNDCIYQKKLKSPGEGEVVWWKREPCKPAWLYTRSLWGPAGSPEENKAASLSLQGRIWTIQDAPNGELGLVLPTAVKWPCLCDFYLLFQQSPRR